jgi:hypothetical protein
MCAEPAWRRGPPERTDAVYVGFANLLMATLDTDPDQVARPGTVDEANFKIG